MTDERAEHRGYISTLERTARSSQVYIQCLRCQTWHPVNVTPSGDDLIIQPGRVVYDDRLGFLCPGCADILFKDDTDQPTGQPTGVDIRHMITDLLTHTPEGLTVRQIAARLNITRGRTVYYIHCLERDDILTRTVTRGAEDVYTLAPVPDDRGHTGHESD